MCGYCCLCLFQNQKNFIVHHMAIVIFLRCVSHSTHRVKTLNCLRRTVYKMCITVCVCIYTGVVCLGGMLYHSCVSSCGRSCRALSSTETCNPDDCAEGCGCADGSYHDDVRQRCVQL